MLQTQLLWLVVIKSAPTGLSHSVTRATNKIASEVATAQSCEFLTQTEQFDLEGEPTHDSTKRKSAIVLHFLLVRPPAMFDLLGTAIAKVSPAKSSAQRIDASSNFSGLK